MAEAAVVSPMQPFYNIKKPSFPNFSTQFFKSKQTKFINAVFLSFLKKLANFSWDYYYIHMRNQVASLKERVFGKSI